MNRILNACAILLALAIGAAGCKPKTPAAPAPTPATPAVASSKPAEEKVPSKIDLLSDLPAAAQAAIKTQVGDGKILKITDSSDDGETVFDIEMKKGEVTRSFSVDEEGTLLTYQIFQSELPPKVLEIFRAEFGPAPLQEISRETADGTNSFTAEAVVEGHTNSLSVVEDGSSWMREIDFSQAPVAVQQTARRVWGASSPTEVTKVFMDGEINYDLRAEIDDRERSLLISSDGKVLESTEEKTLAMIPIQVQTAIKRRLATNEIESISQISDPSGVTFTVRGQKGDDALELTIEPTGKILSAEVTPP